MNFRNRHTGSGELGKEMANHTKEKQSNSLTHFSAASSSANLYLKLAMHYFKQKCYFSNKKKTVVLTKHHSSVWEAAHKTTQRYTLDLTRHFKS
jgi:hypothetical protein